MQLGHLHLSRGISGGILVNILRTVNRINLFIFALEVVIEDASFDYSEPTIKGSLNFDLKGDT
jgi:hypothetical protein